jgi:tetratricopeptide (TPR) repeat protein
MKRETLVALLSGTFFGLLVGWMIGSQQAGPASVAATVASAPASPAEGQASQASSSAPVLDQPRIAELEKTAAAQPGNADVRTALGNLYFNAERYALAIPWYEAALKINPKDVDASTDLGVCYYYTNDSDRALLQFDHSLTLDPKHVKTLFNQGVVRAFGKADLAGAGTSWQKVVDLSPDSEEGKRAKQGLEGLKGHAPGTPADGGSGRAGSGRD